MRESIIGAPYSLRFHSFDDHYIFIFFSAKALTHITQNIHLIIGLELGCEKADLKWI